MESRERVLRAIRHEEVDRVPYYHMGVNTINLALAERFGLNPQDGEGLLARLGADIRYVSPPLVEVPGEDRYGYSFGAVHAKLYNEPGAPESIACPLEAATTVDDLDAWHWPDPDWFDYTIPSQRVKAWADKAVVAYDMGIMFLYAMGVRGMESVMMDMAAEPDIAHEIFRRISEYNTTRTRRFLEANRGLIQIVGLGDDVAGQNGMLLGVPMWRDYLKPHVQKMVDLCHELDVVPYFHGCGGFRDLYSDFIDMGISCTGRLQTEARGNNLADIKREFGRSLCLWGAIDGQHALIEMTAAQVREHVRAVLRTGGEGGGFVAGPTHSFTEDTPVDNVLAVYDVLKNATTTCHELGKGGREA